MQNHKFGNVLDAENYWRESMCSHLEQIMKKYPDYEPEEYIIWIDSAIFLPVQWRTMSAQILLKDDKGNVINQAMIGNYVPLGITLGVAAALIIGTIAYAIYDNKKNPTA